jgi:eukaryotic-like serine/threonine-protein kinase
LVDGGTLADRIGPNGLAAVDVARVGAAAAAGLAAVHQFGMVHRDIRPSNILLSTAGEVKVSDFGFARELEAERVTAAAAAGFDGSTAYLSPEQARGGAVGPPTDVYALGLVLLESLTGHREYPGQAMESAVARLQREPVVPEALPGNWPTLLRAMTNADPARRPTAALAEEALSGLASPVSAPARRPVPAVPPAPYQHKQPPSFGRILAVVLLVLLVTAGVVIGTVAVIRNNETNTNTPTETTTISPTIPPTSLVTTTERITETSRETMAPTPTTPPTLPAPGIGGSQGPETSPIPETPTS